MKLRLVSLAVAVAALPACNAPTAQQPQIVTVTQTAKQQAGAAVAEPTTPAKTSTVTIPDVTGQNARIAQKQLERLGLTDISFSSSNPKYQNVFNATNWTVVSIEPSPGSVVQASDPVVLKVTKP